MFRVYRFAWKTQVMPKRAAPDVRSATKNGKRRWTTGRADALHSIVSGNRLINGICRELGPLLGAEELSVK